MIGKKMARRQKNKMPKNTESSRTLMVSAFWKTLTMQYRNAATQRNHSRRAASITPPTMAT